MSHSTIDCSPFLPRHSSPPPPEFPQFAARRRSSRTNKSVLLVPSPHRNGPFCPPPLSFAVRVLGRVPEVVFLDPTAATLSARHSEWTGHSLVTGVNIVGCKYRAETWACGALAFKVKHPVGARSYEMPSPAGHGRTLRTLPCAMPSTQTQQPDCRNDYE